MMTHSKKNCPHVCEVDGCGNSPAQFHVPCMVKLCQHAQNHMENHPCEEWRFRNLKDGSLAVSDADSKSSGHRRTKSARP